VIVWVVLGLTSFLAVNSCVGLVPYIHLNYITRTHGRADDNITPAPYSMYIVSYEMVFVYVVGMDVEMMDTLEPQYWNTAVLKGYTARSLSQLHRSLPPEQSKDNTVHSYTQQRG
jgi:hypothetical protein